MPISMKALKSQLQMVFKHISRGKLIAIAILVCGVALGFAALITWSGKSDFMPLYANLTPEDAGEIMGALNAKKIPYKLSANGTTIQVPKENLYEVRIELASQGLPHGSDIGFELFDETKLGMTEFVQNVNYQRALQGELSRTINELNEVESSRVHIVMPSQSLFIEEEEPATASISLKLRRGKWLTKDQIQGIVFLVSSSVSKLSPENVTILDNNGKLLAGFQDSDTSRKRTYNQLEFQTKKEHSLENRIKSMLETVLGEDKAIVRVSCDLDFVEQEKTQEMFLPENQVVRSEQLFSETSSEAAPEAEGIPGLATNITQETVETGVAGGPSSFKKQDSTRNYEIGKVTSRQILPTGKLNRLSVAVIVDGTYEKVIVGEGEEATEEIQYVARTPEEMTKFENIVKRAVNYDEVRGDKIEVVNISFDGKKLEPVVEEAPSLFSRVSEYGDYIKYIASGIFIIFSFLFIIRPLIAWLTSDGMEDFELLEQLPKTITELEQEYEQKGENLPFTEQAALLISQNEDHSTKLVQSWLKE